MHWSIYWLTVRERFADAGRIMSNSLVMEIKQEEIMDVANDMEDMEIESLQSSNVQIKQKRKKT